MSDLLDMGDQESFGDHESRDFGDPFPDKPPRTSDSSATQESDLSCSFLEACV